MPRYVIESYAANSGVEEARQRARLAAELAPRIRYLRSTFLPADEFVLHVLEAPSVDALRDAARRAALQYERLVEAQEGSAQE